LTSFAGDVDTNSTRLGLGAKPGASHARLMKEGKSILVLKGQEWFLVQKVRQIHG